MMNGGKLAIIVFIAVLAANLTTLVLVQIWADYQAGRFVVALRSTVDGFLDEERQRQAERQREQARLAAQREKQNRERAREQAREAESRRAAAAKHQETCNLWRRFYAKEKTEYNRLMKDRACSAVP